MTTKLSEKTQELNTALLENIKKDILIKRLSEQLESKPLFSFEFCRDTSVCLFSSKTRAELEQSQMAREQVMDELGQGEH
jgi:hypothetical protein